MKRSSEFKNKYVFGPVLSRRLGISLGVDIVPHKTCTYNCLYCECGKTTSLVKKRKEYVPHNLVIEELDSFLSGSPRLDYITFSGSGEPTLNSGIGKIVGFIKDKYPSYKIAVLTNGSLLYKSSVRKDLAYADLIITSLDALSEKVFNRINRPEKSITADQLIKGIKQASVEFKGKFWVEIFILPGINDSDSELSLIRELLMEINPDKVQLNSMDRPGAEKDLSTPHIKDLLRVKDILLPVESEIISNKNIENSAFENLTPREDPEVLKEKIIMLIERRPCTLNDLKSIFKLNEKELKKYLRQMIKSGRISTSERKRGVFYIKNEEHKH
ncbi:MAG: radical SAM protein, partial [Elusimicrobiota bacterium]